MNLKRLIRSDFTCKSLKDFAMKKTGPHKKSSVCVSTFKLLSGLWGRTPTPSVTSLTWVWSSTIEMCTHTNLWCFPMCRIWWRTGWRKACTPAWKWRGRQRWNIKERKRTSIVWTVGKQGVLGKLNWHQASYIIWKQLKFPINAWQGL